MRLQSESFEQFNAMETAIDNYNSMIREVRELRDEIVTAVDDYVAERSEKWQESERAGEYADFKSFWEDMELEEVDVPDSTPVDQLNEPPTEV